MIKLWKALGTRRSRIYKILSKNTRPFENISYVQSKSFSTSDKNTIDLEEVHEGSTIDRFEKEREEYYRKRNMEVYGYDDYVKPEDYMPVEPEPLSKSIPSEIEQIAQPITIRNKPKRENSKKKEKREKSDQQTKGGSKFMITLASFGVFCSFYSLLKTSSKAVRQYMVISKAVKADERVDRVVYQKTHKDKIPIKIIVKKDKRLSYRELEELVIPLIGTPSPYLNPDSAKKS